MKFCGWAPGVDILTFGQYLQPTPKHLDVVEFVTPEKFEHWRRYGEEVIEFRCVHYQYPHCLPKTNPGLHYARQLMCVVEILGHSLE